MKSLYDKVDTFSQKYMTRYSNIEVFLRALKSGRVDEDLLKEELQKEEEYWNSMGYSRCDYIFSHKSKFTLKSPVVHSLDSLSVLSSQS